MGALFLYAKSDVLWYLARVNKPLPAEYIANSNTLREKWRGNTCSLKVNKSHINLIGARIPKRSLLSQGDGPLLRDPHWKINFRGHHICVPFFSFSTIGICVCYSANKGFSVFGKRAKQQTVGLEPNSAVKHMLEQCHEQGGILWHSRTGNYWHV